MKPVAIVGFDRSSQTWVTNAAERPAARIPELDGALLIDEASLDEAANDFGHLRHLRPIAVLEPATPEDVVKIVRFASEHRIKIAVRLVQAGINDLTLTALKGIDHTERIIGDVTCDGLLIANRVGFLRMEGRNTN